MMNPKYAALFQPLTFPNGMTSRNRIALAAMTHYSSNADGSSNPEEFPYIRRRSKKPGMVITAAYAVTENGRGYDGEPYITDDKFLPDLTRITDEIKQQGALAVLQLHHAGSVAPPDVRDVVGPSAISIPERSQVEPRELSSAEINELITAFGEATLRAIKAGFDGVELHGAFGYLLQQFISPFSNRRNDQWGGDQQRRFAFPLALIKEVKRIVALHSTSPFLVGYRFTPEEALKPGLTMTDALAFTEALVASGVDFIDVLVNNYRSHPRAGLEDLSETRLALISKQIAGHTILLGGGSIYSADEAIDAYSQGLSMITLARSMIIDPEWIEKVEQGRENEIVSSLREDVRSELDIPQPFWNVIWSAPGWFPGTLK